MKDKTSIKITNIRVSGYATKVVIECPDCKHKNNYILHSSPKFTARRVCVGCGAILEFDCEEEK